ncbi:unnamed protein product [Ixodes pacificus]
MSRAQRPDTTAATNDGSCEARETTLIYILAVLVLSLVFLCLVLSLCAFQKTRHQRRLRRRHRMCRRHCDRCRCKCSTADHRRRSWGPRRYCGHEDVSQTSLLAHQGSSSSSDPASPFHPRFNSPASSGSSSTLRTVEGCELTCPVLHSTMMSRRSQSRHLTAGAVLERVRGSETQSDQSCPSVPSLEWDNFQTPLSSSEELLFPDFDWVPRQDAEGQDNSSARSCAPVVDKLEHWV